MKRTLHRLALAGLLAGTIGTASVTAQVNEDEWYDPTDWFDGNNIESDDTYDYASYDYDYDYGFDDTYDYGTDWSSYDTWGDDVWDADYYDANYWDDYDWYDDNEAIDDDLDHIYTFSVYTFPTESQSSGNKAQAKSGSSKDKNASVQQNRSVARLNGTVQGVREMQLKRRSGATATYTLANIRLENGKSTIVNLGRSSQLSDLDLKKGDSIQALGRKGNIAGRTVFVAHKLKADGRTIDANPVIRLSNQQMVQSENKNQKTLQGTVANVSESSSMKGNKQHTLVELELENGKSATVDLGPAASLDRIGLDEGDSVTIRGHARQMNGREVVIPDLLKVDGQKVASVSE